ncbi:MAG TPA: YfiR family protein [Nevskiaceae bacterium]|nr:YfiR family protein [Nevskiaceae bacterium]
MAFNRHIARLFGGLALGLALVSPAQGADDLEQKVRAAFLYNFAKFVSWPGYKTPQASDPLLFCVLDSDPFAGPLEQNLQGKTVDTHPVQVRRVQRVDDMRSCHVAYLSIAESARLAVALEALAGNGVLTVFQGDAAQHAGIVRFFLEDQRMRFEINTAAAERERLEISSRLLGVARVVRE